MEQQDQVVARVKYAAFGADLLESLQALLEGSAREAGVARAEQAVAPGERVLLDAVPAEDEDDVTLDDLKAADAAGGEYTMEDVFKLLEKRK